MATSNHERVGKALEILQKGLRPFFERELRAAYGETWQTMAIGGLPDASSRGNRSADPNWDAQAMLATMWHHWNNVFNRSLGHADRSIVSELRETRNNWAHQRSFTLNDTYRAFDSIQRLLTAVGAVEQASEIEHQQQEILRLRFQEQARQETRKASIVPIEGQPAGGLKPWREIITPHPDVASGRYQQAEFAADLNQVHNGEGADEYRDPSAFFQRTFLTEGLRYLLTTALKRLSDTGGDPVVELQTNFGGGKTHSMLALYHLFSGAKAGDLPGIERLLEEAGIEDLPKVQRVVLVGTALSPAQPQRKADGTVVNTLWGELAWQLLGRDGYELVREADQHGISPGSNVLTDLFTAAAPCMVLIDEWIAYVRMVYVHPDDKDKSEKRNLPGGSFEANMTFAQSLTEAAKACPKVLVVASIPASDIEIGGEGGFEALSRLRNIFGRLESAWRPATAEEGFEIVRRRLFQEIGDPQLYAARDAVVKAFTELYRKESGEFPANSREADYGRRIEAAYPIHPELFDRLYNDWCTLDKFQRTRGVLRLMSAVIHALWSRDDRSLLIMPASIPIDANAVQSELTRYVDSTWAPVIEKDIDGPHSLPLRLDNDNPNLGRYSACRRVARTLYLGSAPTLNNANKGLDDRHIKLGCAQPGENVPIFGDALRRLTDQATHLYVDGQRYWFSTQPSVNRLAQDRAAQQSDEDVAAEILGRLRDEQKQRGDFAAVHVAPATSGDVADEREARLVILPPSANHSARIDTSPARQMAAKVLAERGTGPRRYRNALVFLAADSTRLKDLEQAVRQFLAWQSIHGEGKILNLDPFQMNLAENKRKQADEAVKQRIPETYIWLLAPEQTDPQGEMSWSETRVQGQDGLAKRAGRKLCNDGSLVTDMGATVLRIWLDKIPLWRGEHVQIKQLADDFAQYLYLPRVRDTKVLLEAIQNGVGLLMWEQDSFAYAEGWDAERNRYTGLRTGHVVAVLPDGLVVKAEAARRQRDAEEVLVVPSPVRLPDGDKGPELGKVKLPPPPPSPPLVRKLRRFHGSKRLDATRMNRDVGQITDEVMQHLTGLVGARVRVTIEIEAELPDGAPDNVVRTVTENCRTLRFETSGFEEM